MRSHVRKTEATSKIRRGQVEHSQPPLTRWSLSSSLNTPLTSQLELLYAEVAFIGESWYLGLFRGIAPMWKKLLVAAGVATVAVVVAKKVKSVNDERALWHEATTSAEDVR